jgi:hypothetical protein
MRVALILTSVISVAMTSFAFAQSERIRPGNGAAGGTLHEEGVAPAKRRKPAGATDTVRSPKPVVNSALSKAECEGLGGKVKTNFPCGGDACFTVNKDGVIHMACITENK